MELLFGSQYYRPPFPEKATWESDIANMRLLGFNTVKLWAVWNYIERIPGEFDYSDLDELVEICKANSMYVVLNIIPEGFPYWTQDGHDDCFFCTSEGEKLLFSGPANIPSAGWPGLCPDSPYVSNLIGRFIENATRHFSQFENVWSIDVWNEPHLEPMFDYSGRLLCYCSHSQTRFRNWLKERYGTLEALNANWFRSYTDWDQVEPPRRFGTTADMIDWRRFWLYNINRFLQDRVKSARAGSPSVRIQTHAPFSGYMGGTNKGGLGNELGDEFLMSQEVDVYGLSSFPLWLMGNKHLLGHFVNAEIIADASVNVPFYQAEMQGGPGKKGYLGGYTPSKEDIRMWNYNVIAAGGKGVLYWQYKPEPAGLESPGFGLVKFDGSFTPRAVEAGKCAKSFMISGVDVASRLASLNGIYLSRNSALWSYAVQEEEVYTGSFFGLYCALEESGYPVSFVHGDTLKGAFSRGVRTLYVPMGICLDKDEKEGLVDFTSSGGTLVVENACGLYFENGQAIQPFSFLETLFGLKGCSLERLKDSEGISYRNGAPFLQVADYRLVYDEHSSECRIVSTFIDGVACVLERPIGKGKAVLISGFAGLEYYRTGNALTREFLTGLFDNRGYNVVSETDNDGMSFRLLHSEHSIFAVIINRTDVAKRGSMIVMEEHQEYSVNPKDGVILRFQLKK